MASSLSSSGTSFQYGSLDGFEFGSSDGIQYGSSQNDVDGEDDDDDIDSLYLPSPITIASPLRPPSTPPARLERIGAGSTGSVWSTRHGFISKLVIKRQDGLEIGSLEDEYDTNGDVIAALVEYADQAPAVRFSIPISFVYLDAEDDSWADFLPKFPTLLGRCNSLISERIPHFGFFARYELTETFVPAQHQDAVREDPRSEHCLVRLYLGRRKTDLERPSPPDEEVPPGRLPPPRFFSLRNMVLHIDKIERLDLSVPRYAVVMAEALAFLLWSAKVDAEGVEFVLAPPRPLCTSRAGQREAEIIHSNTMGDHVLWLLDFDCCQQLAMDASGMDHAVDCFLRNDPYFPRPRRRDVQDRVLWSIFRDRFLFESERILENESEQVQDLPRLFMEKLSAEVWRRSLLPSYQGMQYPRVNGFLN